MDTRISSSEFGFYHYQRFLLWSFSQRQSKAALLRDLAVARMGAHKGLIDENTQEYASYYGLSLEELRSRIIQADQERVSVARLHEQLEQEKVAREGLKDD